MGRREMRSLLADLDRPGIDAFLNGVDRVMNSTAFLLKAQMEARISPRNHLELLGSLLHDPLFGEMMLEVDRTRDWLNFQDWRLTEEGPALVPRAGTLVHENVNLTSVALAGEAAFAGRLRWMLMEAFSPYNRHLDEASAQQLVGALFLDLFGPDSWPLAAPPARRYWDSRRWLFWDVRPDFLRPTGYFSGLEPASELSYFDGGQSDTCTLFSEGDLLFLLLTNGSP